MHKSRARIKILMGDLSGKETNRTEERARDVQRMTQPNESLSQALNVPKSGCLKADCSELAFKNVFPARAASIFL